MFDSKCSLPFADLSDESRGGRTSTGTDTALLAVALGTALAVVVTVMTAGLIALLRRGGRSSGQGMATTSVVSNTSEGQAPDLILEEATSRVSRRPVTSLFRYINPTLISNEIKVEIKVGLISNFIIFFEYDKVVIKQL